MRKIIISLICILLPLLAHADNLKIRPDAPDRHVVVKGDTLWDISATFFDDPWRWQEIWGLNKETIKDPHWIYPGDVIILDRTTGTLRVEEPGIVAPPPVEAAVAAPAPEVVKLAPRIRTLASEHDAIPVVPLSEIGPFLSKPMLDEEVSTIGAPTIVGTDEHRTILGSDDIAFVSKLPEDRGIHWQVFRLGKTLEDPDTEEILGREVDYLGNATLEKFATISEVRISKALAEIMVGDFLAQPTRAYDRNFTPHAPASQIAAKVISIYGGIEPAGKNSIITINKGQRDGIEPGNVLALYQKGEVIKRGSFFNREKLVMPNMRYGLIFVFRVFNKVSYALVVQSRLPIALSDLVQTP